MNSITVTKKLQNKNNLVSASFETPIGTMVGISDERSLYLLKFIDDKNLEQEIHRLCVKADASITKGINKLLINVEQEIQSYFAGTLQNFTIPLQPIGTIFQQESWCALQTIEYGKTASYADQATIIKSPNAHRAVANANGRNPIVIIIPCHRIINSNGNLGGYSSGLHRKKILLELESTNRKQ